MQNRTGLALCARLFSQTIGVEAIAGADEDPLLAVEHVGDRPVGLARAHFLMPKHFTLVGAEDDEVLLIVAGDEQIGRGGKNTGSGRGGRVVKIRTFMRPDSVARALISPLEHVPGHANICARAAVAGGMSAIV